MKLLFSHLLLVSLIVSIGYCQDGVFECTDNEAMTDLCNTVVLPIYDQCQANLTVNDNCAICIFGCDYIVQSNDTSSITLTCANDTCVSDLCSSFGLFHNNSLGFTCRDIYSDQYCSYCEKCYSYRDAGCSEDYKTTFCRLLPTDELDQLSCITVYGDIPCSDCAAILGSQTCDPLSLDSLTTQQNDTLCEIGPHCDSLPHAINCTMDNEFALDCRLCSYLFDNNFDCDFNPTSGPVPEQCTTGDGLYCSLVNAANPCDSAYSETTCTSCGEYSFCPPLDIQSITQVEQSVLCNSVDAAVCGVTVSLIYSECLNSSLAADCDFCKATLPVCNYMPITNGNGTDPLNISCDSSAVTTCGHDVSFFPCALIYGLDYCINCIDALTFCGGIPEYDEDFVPPHICDNDYYVSLCDLVTDRADCSALLGDEICDFCTNAVLVNCSSPLDTDDTLDLFCSNSTLDTCLSVVSGNPQCTDIDCTLCRARGTICADRFLTIGSEELDDCYTADDIYCRVYGLNFTTCPSVYSTLCQTCQNTLISCSSLEIDKVPFYEQYIACFNSDVCPGVTGVESFCQQGETYARLCDTCDGFSTLCENTTETGGSSDFCNSDAGSLFCRAYALNRTDCESRFTSGYCELCQFTLLFCPTLSLNEFTDNQTAIACENSEICEVYTNSPTSLCEGENAFFCDICIGFQGHCNSSTSAICNSDIGLGCYISYSYFPCYSTSGNDSTGCDFCASVIDLCPSLVFNESIVPAEICSSDTYLASCSLAVNDPFCDSYYGSLTCSFCQSVFDQCQVSLNYTSVVTALDSSCESFYFTCQFLLSYVSEESCPESLPFADCAFCGVLMSYCPSRVGSYPNCTSELDYFCANISTLDNCQGVYVASTCYDCDMYRLVCEDEDATIDDFCSSTDYMFACSSIPIGSTCRHLAPEESFLCDYCTLYSELCIDSICSVDNLLAQCSSLYTNGTVPTVYGDQCLPCSLVSGVCDNYTVVMESPTMSTVMSTTSIIETTSSVNQTSTQQITTATVTSSAVPQSSTQSTVDMTTASSTKVQSSVVSSTVDQPVTSQATSTSVESSIESSSVQQSSMEATTTAVQSSSVDNPSTMASSVTTSMVPTIVSTMETSVASSTVQSSVTSMDATILSTMVTSMASSTVRASVTSSPISSVSPSTVDSTADSVVQSSSKVDTTTITEKQSTTMASMSIPRSVSRDTTSTRAAQTSTSESPTRSTTPVSNRVSIDDLSDEEIDNAVTMVFGGLTETMFRSNTDKFITDTELLINDVINSRQSSEVNVKIIDESVMQLPGTELEFAIIATQGTDGIISGSILNRIVEQNGATLAQSIGASNFTSVREGVSDNIRGGGESGGLSSGAIAGIIIVVLIVLIVILGGIAIGVYVYAARNRKGRYYISNQHDFTKGQELALSQSMKETDPDIVAPANVIKNDEATHDDDESKAMKEKEAESKLNKDKSSDDSSSSSSSDSEDENTEF